MPQQITDTNNAEVLSKILAENSICADCDEKNPDWACLPHGSVVCLRCSGVHRNLGVDVSFVQSVTMDKWSEERLAQLQGNDAANAILEFCVPRDYLKPVSLSSMADRKRYIGAKYTQKMFVQTQDNDAKAPIYDPSPTPDAEENQQGLVVTTGILLITLMSGKNLKKSDVFGASDPYCVYNNTRQEARSKVIQNSNNPNWHGEHLSLSIEDIKVPIFLEVYDQDIGSNDDHLGSAGIDLSGLIPGGEPVTIESPLSTQGTISAQYQFVQL